MRAWIGDLTLELAPSEKNGLLLLFYRKAGTHKLCG